MGNTEAQHYEEIKEEVFDAVELKRSRNFDCVLVFDLGSDEDWSAPSDTQSIQYDYLSLLDTDDIETRKRKFPQHAADFYESSQPTVKDFFRFERKLVIKALSKLRMKCQRVKAFKSEEKDRNIMMYYIGIQEKEARKFAFKIGYELELEPDAAITYLQLMDETLAKATLSEEDECKKVIKEFWTNVYIKYNNDVAPHIYKPFDVFDDGDAEAGFEDSLFSIRDRCALINGSVTADVEEGGAGIYVPMLQLQDHCILDFFPIHTLEHLEIILHKLFSFQESAALNLPLEEIRVYFGEYIAIYFAFLQFQTKYFLPMVVLGIILGVMQIAEGEILIPGISYFAIVIIAWAIFFPILWKRTEWRIALKWGTLRFDLRERSRPEFKGDWVKSNIDGLREEHYSTGLRNQKRCVSWTIVLTFLIALFASVAGIVLLRVYVAATGMAFGSYIISIVNALVIMFFNNVYGFLAEMLNELENYKTDTDYENNLITKIFVFRFINSYAALYYIAFFRHYEDPNSSLYCTAEVCMEDLEQQLAIIFLTQITVSNAIELGSVFLTRCLAGRGATSYFTDDEKDTLWAQYSSAEYERTFDDYNELIISFGYASLFSIAFPWAPLAAFVGNIVEARIDGYKICKLTRRPFPRQADDIGSWQLSMEAMGWAVLLTNIIMICFTAGSLDFTFLGVGDLLFEETLTALLLVFVLIVAVLLLQYCIATEPRKIAQHKNRQDHIEAAVIKVGGQIDHYLDSLTDEELKSWRSWNVQQVAYFLREVLYKNPTEYKQLEHECRHSKFGGPKFAEADEHTIEKYLQISDANAIRFILNARQIVIDQERLALEQDTILQNVDAHLSQRPDDRKENGGPLFEFSMDHFMQMADFFEQDLTGQSKRRLWQKVDKDMSSLVEKNEMETFLYFSMVVFIKAKFPNVNIPGPKDKDFKSRITRPLQRWLLHYKVSGHGLTFDEFDRYLPVWLREYYKENKQAMRPGGYSKYATIRVEGGYLEEEAVNDDSAGGGGGGKKKNKFGFGSFLGGKKKKLDEKAQKKKKNIRFRDGKNNNNSNNSGQGPSDDTLKYEIRHNIPHSRGVDTTRVRKLSKQVRREDWPPESEEWESKLDDLTHAVEKTDSKLRNKLWDKVARSETVDQLDSHKSLEKLLFSFIALYIKTKDRQKKTPRYLSLQPLLFELAQEMRPMLEGSDHEVIDRDDFVRNIHRYLAKTTVNQRKKAALAVSESVSIKTTMDGMMDTLRSNPDENNNNNGKNKNKNKNKNKGKKQKKGWFG